MPAGGAIRPDDGKSLRRISPTNIPEKVSTVVLNSISKSYQNGGRPIAVIRGLSLEMAAGTFSIVVGKSGSGKSTLLNLIAGLDRPDGGTIDIDGCRISEMPADALAAFRLAHVGLVFQFFNFLPTLMIEENICLPAYLAGSNRPAAARACSELLSALSIEQLRAKYPHEVSGGELQRAAVARALINRPKLVLADEPTGNLDAENGSAVFGLLLELTRSRGASLIMATHELDFRAQADRIIELKNGAADVH